MVLSDSPTMLSEVSTMLSECPTGLLLCSRRSQPYSQRSPQCSQSVLLCSQRSQPYSLSLAYCLTSNHLSKTSTIHFFKKKFKIFSNFLSLHVPTCPHLSPFVPTCPHLSPISCPLSHEMPKGTGTNGDKWGHDHPPLYVFNLTFQTGKQPGIEVLTY